MTEKHQLTFKASVNSAVLIAEDAIFGHFAA
jgi:hypothetical protein